MARLAPYAQQHETLQGPGDARPTATQIIEDQGIIASPSWTGRVILITGCSPGGLGLETAKAIHLTGADVFITARDFIQGKQVAEEILKDGKPGKVEVIQMDLASLESIRAAADDFLRRSGNKLNILINNAGIMTYSQEKTKDGFELHLGVNHLGHFYLFQLVKNALLASANSFFNSRVISVSSTAHQRSTIHFDDLNFEHTEYDPMEAYGQSKLAVVHFTNELDRRYRSQNLRALSLHPGGSITPLLMRSLPKATSDIQAPPEIAKVIKSSDQGAATSVWAAVANELEGKGGLYLDDVAEAEPSPPDAPYWVGGYSARTFDPPTEEKLWTTSLSLIGLKE